ncbi:MAG: hypothetical protein WA435_01715 [Gallionellaceae bacterium]
MAAEKYEPTKPELFARLVMGHLNMFEGAATVQRSHRFPVYYFNQIENLGHIARVPISVIINQLIDCGLEAVKKELPKDVVEQLNLVSKAQSERPTKSVKVEVKARKPTTRKVNKVK